jgi:radical SAM superfamily enzyme YgiQ (UPF0313 family)
MLDLLTAADPRRIVADSIARFKPDVIGLSVRNIDDQRMHDARFLLDQARDAVTWCRESTEVPMILGGAGFSILPQPILDYMGVEMGIQGEGEAVFPELLKRLQSGRNIDELPGVFQRGKPSPARRSFSKGLDSFRLPDPALLTHSLSGAKDAPVPVQTRRGCPLSCSYCSTPTIEGSLVRWRSPESVVAWMARCADEGFRHFYFVDNTFNLPPSYAAHLCNQIIEAKLDVSWRCILFPGGLNERLIELLARAGCREASLGFESGNGHMLHRMKKRFAPEEVLRASEALRRRRIRTMGFLLLGGPGETQASAEESLKFAESLKLDAMRLSIGIRIYPNTEVARIAEREGLIASEQDLLLPKFYVVPDLENWLHKTVASRIAANANWSM